MITLEKKSMVSGKLNTMTLDTTKQALVDYYEGKSGYVQDAFPPLVGVREGVHQDGDNPYRMG